MSRKPVARGFYPFEEEGLENEIKTLLEKAPERTMEPKGLIVPHAGYRFSGETAAHAYKTLRDRELKNAIILGFNHSGIGEKAALSTQTWETPLGDIPINKKLSGQLLKNDLIKEDETAHEKEHSIEVQLPFLKYMYPDIEIVPISLSNQLKKEEMKEISELLKSIEYKENILIASSDLNHVGARFGLTPKQENLEYLEKEDKEFIEDIKNLEIQEIIEKGKKSTICGFIPIAVALETLKEKIKKAEVLHRSNSYEATGNTSSVVGYASIALY